MCEWFLSRSVKFEVRPSSSSPIQSPSISSCQSRSGPLPPDPFLGPLLRTASRDQPPGPSAFFSTRALFFYPECFSVKGTQSLKSRPASTRVTSSDITPSSFRAAGPRTPLVFPPDLRFPASRTSSLRFRTPGPLSSSRIRLRPV
jgi:hypothetical protein